MSDSHAPIPRDLAAVKAIPFGTLAVLAMRAIGRRAWVRAAPLLS